MAKSKTIYVCSECGYESGNWAGKCPSCGSWNTFTEFKTDSKSSKSSGSLFSENSPKKLSELGTSDEVRFSTGIEELDRVLGGGAVNGSLILVGGAPGIGKSTLLLQTCASVEKDKRILYISGEESINQIKMRADRLHVSNPELYILAETNFDFITNEIKKLKPDVVILDSIQTVSSESGDSAPGSISQIKECTMKLMRQAKEAGFTAFIVGHINKEGTIAGPKILEHMVDCVLYFEGERNTSFRILRSAKNRFGSTNEIGVFEMEQSGLRCVPNPSEVLLSGRPEKAPGTCVTCVIEGSRPILAEVQALVSPSQYNPSKRSNGIDYNRVSMLIAVLEKRGGIPVSNCDAYVNVIGGLDLDEPAADLAAILAMTSSYTDKPLANNMAAVGEIGLSGEIRSVSQIGQRLSEIARMGFKYCIVPSNCKADITEPKGLKVIYAESIRAAIKAAFSLKNE